MAKTSGFFNARKVGDAYDRVYDANDFANYFATFVSNGVFGNPTNQLKVVSGGGMKVTVRAGKAYINGYWYNQTEDYDLSISPNVTAYKTNALVCCGLNLNNRTIDIYTRENVADTEPVRNASVYELVLAIVDVKSGVIALTNADINDTRQDSHYCGIVTGLVDQIDETELFAQYEEMFSQWFDRMKGQLSTDAAGNLQNQIDAMATDVAEAKADVKALKDGRVIVSLPISIGVKEMAKSFTANYPQGFTFANCYVETFYTQESGVNQKWHERISTKLSDKYDPKLSVYTNSSNIMVEFYRSGSTTTEPSYNGTVYIVLRKL